MENTFPQQPFSQGVAFVNEVQKSGWNKAKNQFSMNEADAKAWWDWYKKEVCTPWVIHESIVGIEGIEGHQGHAASLDSVPLIVSDIEEVKFAGQVYPLAKNGLYRFLELTQSVRNLILAKNNYWLPILQSLSALQVHGNRENDKPLDELKESLLTCSFVCITCGTIASLAASVLNDVGIRTRQVNALTMAEWNTYDNGHVVFELFCPHREKWILADADMGFLFKRENSYLDAGELWECLRYGRPFELVPLANRMVDPFFLAPSGFNWFLQFRCKWKDDEGKLEWYKRIFQSVGIKEGDIRVFVGEKDKILSYMGAGSVEVLPFSEWRERLYE